MGKLLSLGPRLKYPITISRLLKGVGDEIKKQEPILQYKFTWMQKVGDPFGEQWEEEQTTIADWDSPTDGSIKAWKISEGTVVDKDMVFIDVEETCPHSIQFAGLCGICGKDMTETSWASTSNDTERAKINMIHDQNFLTVSRQEASESRRRVAAEIAKAPKALSGGRSRPNNHSRLYRPHGWRMAERSDIAKLQCSARRQVVPTE